MPQSTVSTKYVSNRRSVARGVLSGWAFFLVEKRKETRIFVIFFGLHCRAVGHSFGERINDASWANMGR